MVANNANIADRVDSPSAGILIVTKDLQYLVGELVSIFISLCFVDIVFIIQACHKLTLLPALFMG